MSGPRAWLERAQDAMRWLAVRQSLRSAGWEAIEPKRAPAGMWWALLWYFAALLASAAVMAHSASAPVRVSLALLPLPPLALIVALSVRRALGMDEMQRRIELAALAVVAVATWLGFGVCWMLRHAGIPLATPLLGFWGMPLLYVFARRWAARRYA